MKNVASMMRRWRAMVILLVVIAFFLISYEISSLWLEHRQERFNLFVDSLKDQGVKVNIRTQEPDWIGPYKKYLPARVIELCSIKQTRVTLAGDKVTRKSLECISQLPNVTALTITDAPNIDDDSLAALSEVKSLEELCVDGTRLSGVGFIHLQNLPKLRAITFGKNTLTEKGIEQLLGMKPFISAFDVVLDSVKTHGFELTGTQGSKSIIVGDFLTIRGSFSSTHFVPNNVKVIVFRTQFRDIEGGQTRDLIEIEGTPTTEDRGVYRFNVSSRVGIQHPGRYRVEVDFYVPDNVNGRLAIGMTLGALEFEVK